MLVAEILKSKGGDVFSVAPDITTSIAWMGINAVVGLIGFAPGAEGARIAWEAHAFGFVAHRWRSASHHHPRRARHGHAVVP